MRGNRALFARKRRLIEDDDEHEDEDPKLRRLG